MLSVSSGPFRQLFLISKQGVQLGRLRRPAGALPRASTPISVVKIVHCMLVPTLGYTVDAVYLRNMLTGEFNDSSWEYYSAINKDYERIDDA